MGREIQGPSITPDSTKVNQSNNTRLWILGAGYIGATEALSWIAIKPVAAYFCHQFIIPLIRDVSAGLSTDYSLPFFNPDEPQRIVISAGFALATSFTIRTTGAVVLYLAAWRKIF